MKHLPKIQAILFMVVFLLIGGRGIGNAENQIQLKKTAPLKMQQKKTAPIKMQQKEKKVFCDLLVSRVQQISKHRKNKNHISLLIFVRNTGAAKSPVSFLQIKSNGKEQAMIHVPPLSPNQTKRITSSIKGMNQEDLGITAIINPGKKFAESDYKNNSLYKKITLEKTMTKSRRMESPNPPPPAPDESPQQSWTFKKIRPQEMQRAVQYSVEIVDPTVGPTSQNGWKWTARLRNTGSNSVPGYRLKLKAYQVPGTMAGAFCMAPSIPKGELSKRMSMTQWAKADDAVDLRLEVWDTQMNTRIASQTIPFPSPMVMTPVASIKNVSLSYPQQGKVRIHVSGRKKTSPAISSNRLRLHISMHVHSTGDTVGVANVYQVSEITEPAGHEFYFHPVEVQYHSGENRIHLKLWDQLWDEVIDEDSFVAHPYQGVQ